MNLQVLRPDPFWLWVQAEEAFAPPQAVLDVPGVSYREPEAGYSLHRLEIPWTAWNVPPLAMWLARIGAGAPDHPFGSRTVRTFPTECKLYHYQEEGIRFLVSQRQAVLGDEMGLGKTRQALVAAEILRNVDAPDAPVLIVGPKYLRATWRNELAALGLAGADTFLALKGTKPSMEALAGAQWIFSHYDVLHAWWSQLLCFKPAVAIVDEVHLAKNSRTRRGKAVALATSITPYRFLLTGTPVENRVGEFWNLLTLATGKWTWGSPRVFRERYAGATVNAHGGLVDGPVATHTDELRQRLELCYLRRTKKDAGVDLPPLTRQVIEVELEDRELEAYRDLCAGMDPSVLLRQLKERRASRATIEWIGRLRKLTAKAKERATIEEITSALEQGEHVLCFTWQKKTAERIAGATRIWTHGGQGRSLLVHGEHSTTSREFSVARFQEHGGLLVATLDSLGVGVTLHKASLVVMHDLDWVPSRMLQAEARAHRIGLDHPVLSKWMVAKGTLDEMLVKALLKKAPRIAETVGDTEPSDLADLLGEAIDERGDSLDELLSWAKGG